MIKIFKFIVPCLLIAGCFFSSCTHTEPELATLDSMQVFLAKADSFRKSVDTAKLAALVNEVNSNLATVENNYMGDTLDEKTALLLQNYRNLGTAIQQYGEELKKTGAELDESKKQLSDLEHDVQKELIPEKQLEEYVEQEKAATLAVCNKVYLLQKAIGLSYVDHESLLEQVKPLLKKNE